MFRSTWSADSAAAKAMQRSGVSGYLQVNTGSVTKHGDAFVLLTDMNGNALGTKNFGMARHDVVNTIFDLGSEKIMVGGYKEGPITHDGDNDKTRIYSFGFVKTFSLMDILEK